MKIKIIRACTVADSIGFFSGMMPDLMKKYEVCVLSSPGTLWSDIMKYGDAVKRIEVPMERHISPFRDLKSLIKIIHAFHREKPVMVHSMTPKAGLLCMLAARLTNVPVRVHTFTGLVFPTAKGLTKRILMATDWLTCACATHIIPEGEGVKKDLVNHKITNKPLKVLGYGNCQGIDLNKFNPTLPDTLAQAENIRKKEVFTFITIGRVVGDKGINELVSAFSRLNSEISETRLLLVGGYEANLDPLAPETMTEIENNEAIEAVGQQNDVRPWLMAADCAVLASYREGFPNVVIEAGAMGLPQIVTNINGANEIIVEGKNGTIVPSRDVEALYTTMKRMVNDTVWRAELASNARPMVASRYEQGYVRRCLYDFYDEILVNHK